MHRAGHPPSLSHGHRANHILLAYLECCLSMLDAGVTLFSLVTVPTKQDPLLSLVPAVGLTAMTLVLVPAILLDRIVCPIADVIAILSASALLVIKDSSADKVMAIIVVFLAISLLARRVIRRRNQNSMSEMIVSKEPDMDLDYPDTPMSYVTNERTALMGRHWFPGPSNIQTV